MGYRHWVFLHVAGVFGFLAAHGVSMVMALRLRRERDAARINALLDLSARTTGFTYASLGALLAGGIGATFSGKLWAFGWIWGALALLTITVLAMIFMAKPYYAKVRFVSRAVAEGSKAVSDEQFDSVLASSRSTTIMGIGFVGLTLILLLMVFKPTLGLAPEPTKIAAPTGPSITAVSVDSKFTDESLTAPADVAFSVVFDNRDSGIPHNFAIYRDAAFRNKVFIGETFPGRDKRLHKIGPLAAGTYSFRCDVHPDDMIGTLVVE